VFPFIAEATWNRMIYCSSVMKHRDSVQWREQPVCAEQDYNLLSRICICWALGYPSDGIFSEGYGNL